MLCKTGGNLCLPGTEIPNWIRHQTVGSLISFRVPSFLDDETGNMLVCVVYAANKEAPRELDRWGWFRLRFCNRSRYPPKYFEIESNNCFFDSCDDHIFVEVRGFHEIELEMNSGDRIELFIKVLLYEEMNCEIQVKKLGIHLLFGDPNEVIDKPESALLRMLRSDPSANPERKSPQI